MVLMRLMDSIDNRIVEPILKKFDTSLRGLSDEEAEERIEKYGYNEVGEEVRKSLLQKLIENFKNPLVVLLGVLAAISYITGDTRAAVVMIVMVAMGVALKFIQEIKADKSAEELKSMVSTTASVIRDGMQREIPLKMLVPGDYTFGLG